MTIAPSSLRTVLLLTALAGVLPTFAHAQQATDVKPDRPRVGLVLHEGDRLKMRFRASPESKSPVIAAFVRHDGATLMVQRSGANDTTAVRTMDLHQLHVMLARHRRIGRYTAAGLFIGAAMGGMIGWAHGDDPPDLFLSLSRADKAAVGAMLLTLPGGLIGAVLGIPRRDVWTRVPIY